MPIVKHQLTFDGGEWSPWLDGRSDLAKYTSACRRLENFIIRPQGGVCKRPGLESCGKGKGSTVRLVEFEIQGDDSLILALGGGVMKVFAAGSAVQSGGVDLEVAIPWTGGQLPLLRWKQINDVMFFTHPEYEPTQLRRFANDSWAMAGLVPNSKAPFLPENTDDAHTLQASYPASPVANAWTSTTATINVGAKVTHLGITYTCQVKHTTSTTRVITFIGYDEAKTGGSTPSQGNTAPTRNYYNYRILKFDGFKLIWLPSNESTLDSAAPAGQEISLISNKALFDASHAGALFQISTKREPWQFETVRAYGVTTTAPLYSAVLKVNGRWTFTTAGTWYGTYHVEESTDGGVTYVAIRTFQSSTASPRNASAEGETDGRVLLRIKYSNHQGGTTGAHAILSAEDAYMRGVVKILTVTDSMNAIVEVVSPVENVTTRYWAEGAWSGYQGYPRALEIHQGRLILASTARRTHTVWGSASDDYSNFEHGTDADQAFAHTVMIGQREPISWLASDRSLIIGSGVAEFSLRGETEDKAITPEFGMATRNSSIGSHAEAPGALRTNAATLFVQNGGRALRELSYRFDSDRYEDGNLTLLAEHLFSDGPIIDFALTHNPFQIAWFVAGGKLFSLTYERGQNIAGWSRHPTTGTVLSVACLRKPGEDEVWIAALRNGQVCIERMAPGLLNAADDGRWLDSYTVLTSPYSLTGHHLDGQTVAGWNNGTALAPAVLSAEFFTGKTGPVTVGLPYAAKLMPMTPETSMDNGSSRSREARIHSLTLSLHRARGGKMGENPDGTKFDPINAGSSAALFSGETGEKQFDGGHSTAGDFCVISDEPFPFGIRSLAIKLNYFGDAR